MPVLEAYHDSHKDFFRAPFGAVPCGSTIRLRIMFKKPDHAENEPKRIAEQEEKVKEVDIVKEVEEAEEVKKIKVVEESVIDECILRFWVNNQEVLYPMEQVAFEQQLDHILPAGWNKNEVRIYEMYYQAPKEPGLVWYFFVFNAEGKTYFYGNNGEHLGGIGQLYQQEPPGYQITVYEPMTLPHWYTRGIMYQIYVDRFYNGNEDGKVLNPRPRSLIHGDWYDTPFYIKNDKGEVIRWDFFGGNLLGVKKKLPFLKELGISIIYFNPIFDSSSNHKYDTGDYLKIDPMYGDEETFAQLVHEAQALGISVILDGVFSHTGDDSIYFNRYGNYPSLGAYQSPESPYYSWYKWQEDGGYTCWWGVKTLPEVKEMEPSYRDFIIHSPKGVLQTWLRYGIKGWRLDVADELPDEFIQEFRRVMKKIEPEAVLIGEVWEDPTNKFSHGQLRQYFWGKELDGTMNYLWRDIFLHYLLGHMDAYKVHQRLMNLYENFPRENFFGQMNIIGSHDRARILTLLGEAPPQEQLSVYEQENYRLPPDKRWLAKQRLKLFFLIQMSFPGVPCIYYGDEAGLEGYPDPNNRGTYPWGREDQELLEWVKRVLRYRREYEVLITGEFQSCPLTGRVYAFKRIGELEEIMVLVNPQQDKYEEVVITLESEVEQVIDIFTGQIIYKRKQETYQESYGEELPYRDEVFHRDEVSHREELGYQKVHFAYPKLDYYEKPKMGFLYNHELKIVLPPLTAKALLCQKYSAQRFFKKEIMSRSCGILLPISSLPSPGGIGDLGPEAYHFLDFLVEAGQSLWQVLPLNPLGLRDSPYQSESAFAGNTLFISMELLVTAGLLTREEVEEEYSKSAKKHQKDDDKPKEHEENAGSGFFWVKEYKDVLLRKAYGRFRNCLDNKNIDSSTGYSENKNSDPRCWDPNYCDTNYLNPHNYETFIQDNSYWLKDYALYKCLKHKFQDLGWQQWEEKYLNREPGALEELERAYFQEIDYIYFGEYTFSYQWQRLKQYANARGIKILGDIPIFVAYDSCDTWANRELFALDAQNYPKGTAGVPPDYFSPTGQNWGNPLYDWEALERIGYAWWIQRIKQSLERFDVVRLDHFRGFEAYWEVPAGAKTAQEGRWLKGPGKRFFEQLVSELGPLPLIAEDLGIITPEVKTLKALCGFPGMQVYQFSQKDGSGEERGEEYGQETVYYSGTHDNDTLLGWYLARGYDYDKALEMVDKAMEELYGGKGTWVILPLQDVLKLDSRARMNIPGTIKGNWQWRVEKEQISRKVSFRLKDLAVKYGRGRGVDDHFFLGTI